MKRAFRRKLEARKYRLKRRGRSISMDLSRSILLIFLVTSIAVLLVFAYNFAISAPCFRIRETVVRGCREVTEKEVLLLSSLKSSQGLLTLNEEAVLRRIRANPWIKTVSLGREFPDRLVIQISERSAIAVIRQEANLYLMDQEGVIFKKLGKNDEVDLPVLTGLYVQGKLNEALLKSARDLLHDLAASKSYPTLDRISEIQANEVLGLSIFTDNGFCIVLGFDGYRAKLQRLTLILEDMQKRPLEGNFFRIDLRNPLKVTVSRRDIPAPKGPASPRQEYKL